MHFVLNVLYSCDQHSFTLVLRVVEVVKMSPVGEC